MCGVTCLSPVPGWSALLVESRGCVLRSASHLPLTTFCSRLRRSSCLHRIAVNSRALPPSAFCLLTLSRRLIALDCAHTLAPSALPPLVSIFPVARATLSVFMAIRLLALDLDGTLLDPRGRITQRNLNAIESARAAGVPRCPRAPSARL